MGTPHVPDTTAMATLHRFLGAGLLGVLAASPLLALPQDPDGNPRSIPAPGTGEQAADPGPSEPDFGERLGPEAFANSRIETMAEVEARDAARRFDETPHQRLRGGRDGAWVVPGDEMPRHSGDRAAINEWGDRSMGIGFGRPVTLKGVWLAGAGGPGSEARAVVAVGHYAGEVVAEAEVFTPRAGEAAWYAIDLVGIDRVVFEIRDARDGPAWYTIDDLTFLDGAERSVVDFEDVAPRTRLSGGRHAGLDWETGTGFRSRGPVRAPLVGPPPALAPAPAAPSPVPALPPTAPRLAPAPTAPTALGGPAPPDSLGEFQGQTYFSQSGTGAFPADAHCAAGPTHLASVVNENITVRLKSNGATLSSVSLTSFFSAGTAGDPRIVYDPDSDRFVLTATDFSSTIHLAVSLTNNPAGAWFKTSLLASQGADASKWPDFPTLGVDQRGVYVAAAMFPGGTGSVTMSIFAFDKAPLVSGTPSLGTVTAWRSQPYVRAIQPATHWDDKGEALLVNTFGTSQLQIRRILPPLTSPALLSASLVTVGSHSDPPLAESLGSFTDIDAGDDRLAMAVYRDDSLWTCHTTDVGGRAAVRWYQVDTSPYSVVQNGTVSDPSLNYYYPSLAVNDGGDVVLGFCSSNSSSFISACYAGRRSSDSPGQMSDPVLYEAGLDSYTRLDSFGRNRWGDYSGSSADPVDDTFWTGQLYATTSSGVVGDRWSVRFAHLEYVDNSVINYCQANPNSFSSGALMSSTGSTSVAANDLVLVCSGMPPGEFMLFFYGNQQTQSPLGDGFLCVTGQLFRLLPPLQVDGFGVTTMALDVTQPPQLAGTITAGSTWNFQTWYRDDPTFGSGSNTSDGLQVSFAP